MMRFAWTGLFVALLALTGCTRESGKGGPGATKGATTKAPNTEDVKEARQELKEAKQEARAENTFKLQVPSGATNVTQGMNQEATISVDRGDSFKQAVKLGFKTPQGVKVSPAEPAIKAGENEVKVLIQVAADAPVGRHTVVVTGTPETGAAVSVNMDIDVKQKD